MDFLTKCRCGHLQVGEHDLAGDQRACRYCPCVLQPIAGEQWRLPVRSTGMFRKKPDWLKPHPIYGSGLGFAEVTGAGAEGIFIMAEALGEDEERASKPLVGPTGRNTARMIARIPDPADPSRRLDLDRDFWRSNIIPFKPPFNKIDSFNWQERSWLFELCKPHWEAELAAKKPRAILALGDHALWALTGRRGITKVRGAVCETPYGPVIPTYHPAYIMRGKIHLTKIWQTDLRRALFVARHGVPKYETSYRLNPTIQDVEAFYNEWVAAGRPPISFDIETPYSNDKDEDPLGGDDAADSDKPISEDSTYNILEIGFCFGARSGINMPWAGAFREWALRILAEAETLFSWNGFSFDGPRLAADGAILGGDHVDLMLLWHLLEPALPMGLKPTATMFYIDVPAAWACKDMSDKRSPDYNPRLYNVLDVDFTLRLGLQLVERAKAEGKWEVFKRQYVQLDRVLRAASRKGVRTNPVIRAEARVKFEARFLELVETLQPLVPLDILPRQTYVGSEEKLRSPRTRLGETLPPIWEEGRMVEVEVLVKPPKPKKKTWKVFYMKALKAGPAEKSKQIKAFTAEEAMAEVPGALRAEEVLSESSS